MTTNIWKVCRFPCQKFVDISESSTATLLIWTLWIWGFRGPGFRSARHVLCTDASRLFLCLFSKHLSSVLVGRTESCHEVRNQTTITYKSTTQTQENNWRNNRNSFNLCKNNNREHSEEKQLNHNNYLCHHKNNWALPQKLFLYDHHLV